MSNIIGEVAYKVTLDTKDLTEGSKKASSELDKMKTSAESGNGIMSKLGGAMQMAGKVGAVAFSAATAGVIALGKGAIDAYADYEQLTGGVEKLFGNASETVLTNANKAFQTVGLSANDYMETVTSFSASLISSVGGDTEKAAQYADQALQDMADNANTFGSSMESIQNAYQGFAKQNYSMLDNLKLGYGGTKSEMERLLADAGKIAGVKFNIDSYADVTQAIHVMQENMKIAGTTTKEASGTISGSINSMKSAWTNVLTAIGSGDDNQMKQALDGLIESFGNVVKNLTGLLPNIVEGITGLINTLVPMLPQLIQTILPPLIQAAVSLVNGLIEALPSILQAIMDSLPTIIEGIISMVSVLLQNITPILMAIIQIVLAIAQELTKPDNLTAILEAAVQLLMALIEAIPQILEALAVALPDILTNIIAFLTDPKTIALLIQAGFTLFMALVQAIPMILSALFSAFANLFSSLWLKLKTLFTDFAGKFGNAIGSVFKNAINSVFKFIENFINMPINAINGFIGVINSTFGVIGVNIGRISKVSLPRLATGGVVESRTGGQVIVAGEAGEDEWVVPESKMASLISKMNEKSGGMNGVTINVYGTFATSADEQRKVATQIYQRLQEINKSRLGAS
ncbi:phage tail protein [Sharpea azabuensis]